MKNIITYYTFILITTFSFWANAQNTIDAKKKSSIVKSAETVKGAYDSNDDAEISKSYEQLAKEFYIKKQYAKAEEYYKKAIEKLSKNKNKKDIARLKRELAKSQEAQNKITEAIQSYEDASVGFDYADANMVEAEKAITTEIQVETDPRGNTTLVGKNVKKDANWTSNTKTPAKPSGDGIFTPTSNTSIAPNGNGLGESVQPTLKREEKRLDGEENITTQNTGYYNFNDVQRLQNKTNTEAQEKYLQKNIGALTQEKPSDAVGEELADNYSKLGDIKVAQNNLPAAIQNYSNAFGIATISGATSTITTSGNQLSSVYLASGKFKEAINVQKKILNNPEIKNNLDVKITQIQNLANIYEQQQNPEEALKLYAESYNLALKEHKTINAKNSLEAMAKIYNQKENTQKSIQLYEQFIANLDSLIQKDNSIIDVKLLESTEEKIKQLEAEKTLKDQLIKKKNTLNYFLIAASILLLLLLFFIGRTLTAIKIKNKKIALQSLRREMNPHFVFNSLNSINQFISQNNELEANKYLISYSNLMRNMMENSNKDFISLSTEIELIKRYLDLEKLRFSEKFDYKITVDETIDTDAILIPNMIIQPNLENAIWHGLRYLDNKGLLTVNFSLHEKFVIITIQDNGIGLTKSKELKTKNQQSHQSIGLSNTEQRIELLNELYAKNIQFKITELQQPNCGTLVKITFLS